MKARLISVAPSRPGKVRVIYEFTDDADVPLGAPLIDHRPADENATAFVAMRLEAMQLVEAQRAEEIEA